jgi:hypothetical protein
MLTIFSSPAIGRIELHFSLEARMPHYNMHPMKFDIDLRDLIIRCRSPNSTLGDIALWKNAQNMIDGRSWKRIVVYLLNILKTNKKR